MSQEAHPPNLPGNSFHVCLLMSVCVPHLSTLPVLEPLGKYSIGLSQSWELTSVYILLGKLGKVSCTRKYSLISFNFKTKKRPVFKSWHRNNCAAVYPLTTMFLNYKIDMWVGNNLHYSEEQVSLKTSLRQHVFMFIPLESPPKLYNI